jgi:hypothetical protein
MREVLREQQREAAKRKQSPPPLNVGVSELFRIAVSGACTSAFWSWDLR